MDALYRELSRDRRFGVELEVSNTISKRAIGRILQDYEDTCATYRKVVVTPGSKGWQETRDNNYWHVKYDSTCGPLGKGSDHGWEVASYIGQGHGDVLKVTSAASWLHRFGLKTNKNCGLHIHVEVKDLENHHMGILLARWIKVEKFLTRICSPERRMSKYCRSLRSRWNEREWIGYKCCNPTDFWITMSPSNFGTHNNGDKKYTLNTVGYALGKIVNHHDRQTLELRLPECSLESVHVLNWLQLIMNLVDVCKEKTEGPEDLYPAQSVSEVLALLGLHHENGTFVFLDKKLLGTKLWLLQKFIDSPQILRSYAKEADELLAFISEF